MTSDDFRKIALSMPDAVEAGHMDHPDFRVGGHVFATLGYPNGEYGMLKLTPDEQNVILAAKPGVFTAAKGAWGRNGSTLVRLDVADAATTTRAMELAHDEVRRRSVAKQRTQQKVSRA